MKHQAVIDHIVEWLKNYSNNSKTNGFVVGISGGIDSALTSTLCALTGKRLMVVSMPIRQHHAEFNRGNEHLQWLVQHFPNVEMATTDLTPIFESMEQHLPTTLQDFLTMANTRSRLRMITLYAYATHHQLLVAGTGNKVEDFGVGFYTKYGDGGVDISPIADLFKTEVYALAQHLGIVSSILQAAPTDGLFADGRSDEDQIGATYPELEWAMRYLESKSAAALTERQQTVMQIYKTRHAANQHKMNPIPVCNIPTALKE